jgi:Flp pilus assembly protein CpaB
MVAALVGGLAYLNGVGQQPTYPVLMPARDLPRGTVLSTDDFVPQRVALPDTMATATVPSSAQAQIAGQRLAEPVHAGVPLLESQLAGPTQIVPGLVRVALPVPPEHAAGGQLDVGDDVRIYVTTNRGKPDAHTSVGLERAVISAVGFADTGLASSASTSADSTQRPRGKLAWIEVLVPDAHAADFVQALADGDPDVAVLAPTPPAPTGATSR